LPLLTDKIIFFGLMDRQYPDVIKHKL